MMHDGVAFKTGPHPIALPEREREEQAAAAERKARRLPAWLIVAGAIVVFAASFAAASGALDKWPRLMGAWPGFRLPNGTGGKPAPPVIEFGADAEGFAEGFLDACGHPCTIRGSGGGRLDRFLQLAAAINREQRTVVIDGPCYSACSLLADRARANVCITPNAEFGFHRGSDESIAPYSGDLVAWVELNGGFPAFSTGLLTKMDAATARAFFAPCQTAWKICQREGDKLHCILVP